MELNEKDEHLLALLKENARYSISELARKLGVSRTAAQMRLEKLERNGVIEGYTVRLGDELRKSQIRALVMIKSPPASRAEVERELKQFIKLTSLYSISGSFDLVAVVTATSVGELDQMIDTIGRLEGVEDTMSSIILSTKVDR